MINLRFEVYILCVFYVLLKNKAMNKLIYTITLSGLLLASCTGVDEEILPVVGVYRSHILGVAGPFDLIVSSDRGDDVLMEAPFDGLDWYVLRADIDDQGPGVMDIDIPSQQIGNGIRISGGGFYSDGTIELEYRIDYGDEKLYFKLIGTK